LFFSDHCGCGKLITTNEVLRKVAVEFFCIDGKLKESTAEFFVRQKYFSTSDDVHVATLTLQDLSPETPCPCDPDENLPIYQCGDFVLIKEQDRLQPYRFEFYEENRAWVRKLERRREVEGTGKVNELVWTETAIDVSPRRIIRKCHVVRVQEGEKIPRLADWSGSSDWFFYRVRKEITHGDDVKAEEVEEMADFDEDILIHYYIGGQEGPVAGMYDSATVTTEPESNSLQNVREHTETDSMEGDSDDVPEDKKLRGLDLFCGGGNFGRGVADGGAVHFKWLYPLMMALTIRAIDININAIHTYKANLEHDDVKLYFGSIINFLFDVINGRNGELPRPGDIDFILAGSPCRGFSNANPQGHEALKSRHNSALVCTIISAIDLYRPKYAILENVPAMAADRKYRNKSVNVSNQIMCALIGMGYQCRCLHLDACHFGSPQSRLRLFIQIAAPGCILPEVPPGSHAHPLDFENHTVDCKFAECGLDTLTAFPPVKLQDVWDDLPSIGNAHLDVCIPYPDHKTSSTANARDRQLISYIPHSDSFVPDSGSRCPRYTYALDRGLIPDHLQLRFVPFKATDRRFERLSPQGFAGAVTCVTTAQNRISGKVLHYREDRVISILEAKRLQGFFDTDILIGKPESAFRIIGNSVCRQVAFALGGKLAEALRKGLAAERMQQPLTVRNVSKVDRMKAPSSMRFMVLIEKREKKHKSDTDINREQDKLTTRDFK
jgi:DNA (cytosine-5)-methyltransferase 1